jgi:DNA-directed RNA polymerase subunit omega
VKFRFAPILENAFMLEDLKEETIVNKVGGRFKLSTLMQKRLVQLNQGSRPLVNAGTQDRMQIVLQEIMQDKIFLDTSNEVRITGEMASEGPSFDLGDL